MSDMFFGNYSAFQSLETKNERKEILSPGKQILHVCIALENDPILL